MSPGDAGRSSSPSARLTQHVGVASKRPQYTVRHDGLQALKKMRARWRVVVSVMIALMATVTCVTMLSLSFYEHSLHSIETYAARCGEGRSRLVVCEVRVGAV